MTVRVYCVYCHEFVYVELVVNAKCPYCENRVINRIRNEDIKE